MSAIERVELAECPFCGGEAESYEGCYDSFVKCEKCGAEGALAASEAEAITAWNHRALAKSAGQGDVVERVARAICGRDLEWRDCEQACLAAGKCVGNLSDCVIEDAKAALAAVPAGAEMREAVHLYLGERTYCGEWLNPTVSTTIAVHECDCKRCLIAYAQELEGDSDNPLRVAAASKVYAQAEALATPASTEQE